MTEEVRKLFQDLVWLGSMALSKDNILAACKMEDCGLAVVTDDGCDFIVRLTDEGLAYWEIAK